MADKKLKEALDNCLVNFDRRVHVTDLLQEYELTYQEVDAALQEYLIRQENLGVQFEKRFLVHGEEQDSSTEVFTVVQGENKLKEWLAKLKNAETSLYSVEVAGGAKAPAQVFQPIRRCALELKNLKVRETIKKTSATPKDASTVIRPTVKTENKQFSKSGSKPSVAPITTTESSIAAVGKLKTKSPEVKKTSPEKKKLPQKGAPKRGGIGNFFSPATATGKSTSKSEVKIATTAKPPTPKGMQDFFKKQTEKTPIKDATKDAANASIPLFSDGNESESSDEEEKLKALHRDVITSDHEEEAAGPSKGKAKRRRIEDSDDEEEAPHQKHEKRDKVVVENEAPKNTPNPGPYLDDEGFVITIKSKKPNAPPAKPAKIKPPAPTPSQMKVASKSKPSLVPPSKTKQGNIMNFFKKK